MVNNSDQFFSIEHAFQVNAIPLALGAPLPTQEAFELSIPAPFKLASQISTIDSQTLSSIRQIGGVAVELAEFLNLQAKKIDMMMGYLLTTHDEEQFRHQGIKFGGSQLTYLSPQSLAIEQLVTLKIFISETNCAVYCIGRVTACQASDDQFMIDVQYTKIIADDQEHLVRTSLQVQSIALKQRAEKRKENKQ